MRQYTQGMIANEIRSHIPLTDDQIHEVAPSIFSKEKYHDRSDSYTCIPTIDIITQLRKEGFEPFMVAQALTRTPDKREFTKHMIRMRHVTQVNDGEANEVILVNSHGAVAASYQMLAGIFRFVCANGMVCGDTFSDIRIPHRGNVVERVVNGSHEILKNFQRVNEAKGEMREITLNHDEQLAYADSALKLKYDDEDKCPIIGRQLLTPRRREDQPNDLWTVTNRIQEHLTQGGLPGRVPNAKRRTRTRGVKAITENVKLNRAIWDLAEAMKQIKLAA